MDLAKEKEQESGVPDPVTAHRSRPDQRSQSVRTAVAIALIGVIPITLFVQWSDLIVGGTLVAGPFPPIAASLFWAILLAFNALHARLFGGKPRLARNELLLILAIWMIANMTAGRGFLHPMLASIVGPSYQARNSAMSGTISQSVPEWLAITDKSAVRMFFEGHNAPVPWGLWWRPLLTWSLFFVPFLIANVCLCALFERIWVRHERLAFPLVALPIETVGFQAGGALDPHKGAFLAGIRTPFLIGLAFPMVVHGLGLANAYIPGIPAVPLQHDISSLFSAFPWTVICPVSISVYPILIGLTFLAPADVTLGVWFFLLVNKAEMLLSAIMGWTNGPVIYSTRSVPPYVEEQSAGAYLALGGMLVWQARAHLRKIADAMWPAKGLDSEYAAYRPLAWGFALGFAGVLIWSMATGYPLWFAAFYFGFYFTAALVLSRLMAEGGISWVLAPILPDKLILTLFGSSLVSPVVITRLMYSMQHLRDTRQMLAPAVFETGKIRDVIGFPLRKFYGLLLVTIALTLVIGAGCALPIFYKHGALVLLSQNAGVTMSARTMPQAAVGQAVERLRIPVGMSPAAWAAVGAGALIVCGLTALRLNFFWWPLHPLGYALTGTLQVGYANDMLFSIFAGWAFKALTLKFGGMRGFRYMRGIAFGLIVGDLLMGGVVKAFDALLGPSGYAIF